MKQWLIVGMSLLSWNAWSQQIPPEADNLVVTPRPITLAFAGIPREASENKKDPAYATYKEGYNAILDERWDDATKKFSEITSRYPKSEYLDDAAYWNAYALSHIDRAKGVEAYKKFVKDYPKSTYIDDAVADLGNLDPSVVVDVTTGSTHGTPAPRAYTYSFDTKANASHIELKTQAAVMRRLNRQLARSFAPRPGIPAMPRIPSITLWDHDRDAKLDPDTRVRLEALYAIGDTKEDETSFQTLKDVALDRGQNIRLRQAAIEVLSDFKTFDVVPVFIELAKKDTNEAIQDAAIEFIGQSSKDKDKSVDALSELYKSIPRSRKEKRETVLFTIADVGNDKAVDFLSTVARTDDDYGLRSDAVYYLGTIGGEKARTALYQILKSK